MVCRFVATGGLGMKGVDTIARIGREHFVRGKSVKEIVRELHVSRNTVRKALQAGATAFRYEQEVQPRPRVGPWRDALDGLLAGNEGKPARATMTAGAYVPLSFLPPSRSWISAAWTRAQSRRPSVSVRMCRLQPVIFLPAS